MYTTNTKSQIDKRIVRPGRIDKTIHFKYSQKEINVNLFNDKLYKINLNTHV